MSTGVFFFLTLYTDFLLCSFFIIAKGLPKLVHICFTRKCPFSRKNPGKLESPSLCHMLISWDVIVVMEAGSYIEMYSTVGTHVKILDEDYIGVGSNQKD